MFPAPFPIAAIFGFDTLDTRTIIFVLAVLGTLVVMMVIGQVLKRQPESHIDPSIIRNFNKRVLTWFTVCLLLIVTLLFNETFTVVLFGLVSFWAYREFITMTPTRRGDHRTLFWVLFVFTPLQYVMVGLNAYALYTVVIPVYGSLFIAGRIAFANDPKRFLERIAKIQFGLLICVYCLSHAPALLKLDLISWNHTTRQYEPWTGKPSGLLFFFIVIVQVSDMLHFIWDRVAGKHVIAPTVNATRTWEGLIGSACCSAVFGILIQLVLPVTPFTSYGAGFMALIISIMATSGAMTLSAIKRDRGINDYGTLVQGHAGVLDRIDTLCFAAPIFFHLTRFILENPETDSHSFENANEVARLLGSLL